jgi:hypothetical protein
MSLATQEQEQRTRWDLLLLDLEHRAEQIRELKTIDLTNKATKATVSSLRRSPQPQQYSRPVESSGA